MDVGNPTENVIGTMDDLPAYAVESGGIPQAYYIPNFVSEYEEEFLIRQVSRLFPFHYSA